MTVTFLSLPSLMSSPVTFAPETCGVPSLTSWPSSTNSTLSKVIFPPFSAATFSIVKTDPSVTTYCLPPVSMIAILAIRARNIARLLLQRKLHRRFVQKSLTGFYFIHDFCELTVTDTRNLVILLYGGRYLFAQCIERPAEFCVFCLEYLNLSDDAV